MVAVQAAIDGHLPAELASIESLIFDTFLGRLCSLRIYSIRHVPRLARPRLASCLCWEFSTVSRSGLWGFVQLLMFPKFVLRSPPCAGRKKRCLVGSLITERLDQWRFGTGIVRLWQDACAGETHFGDTAASEDVLAGHNVRWASHGRYGNALQALGSKGVAPFNDVAAKEELLRRHPQSLIPFHSSYFPPLVVQSSTVLAALRSFPFAPNTFLMLFVVTLLLLLLSVYKP